MVNAIEVDEMRKAYPSRRGAPTVALDGVDLVVPEGGVFGILGPNGSGKTTLIRCLLGLTRPTAGKAWMLGSEVPGDLGAIIQRIGAVVEVPAMFPTFTGRRNLELLAGYYGIAPRKVDETLGMVGLRSRADDLVRAYSFGMLQRLGLAATLLKDPSLFLLDEPANGLDPGGIREIRQLLRRLGAEGRTVFVSSHILAEVQQICDRVAILSRGRLVATGPVHELLGRTAGHFLRVDEPARGLETVTAAGFRAVPVDAGIRALVSSEETKAVVRALTENGIYPTEIRPDEPTLEDVFLELTHEQEPEP